MEWVSKCSRDVRALVSPPRYADGRPAKGDRWLGRLVEYTQQHQNRHVNWQEQQDQKRVQETVEAQTRRTHPNAHANAHAHPRAPCLTTRGSRSHLAAGVHKEKLSKDKAERMVRRGMRKCDILDHYVDSLTENTNWLQPSSKL